MRRPVGRRRGRYGAAALAVAMSIAAADAAAQTHPNLDFETGLSGWTAAGDAFGGQPLDASAVDRQRFPASPLGGDYWTLTSYPIGQHGRFLVSTTGTGRGTLTSDAFVADAEHRYFSVLVGSSRDPVGQRVELQVRAADGTWRVAWETPGPGIALLQQRTFAIPPDVAGQEMRIVVVDDSAAAQIHVDFARLTDTPLQPEPAPVWGVADYHAHPMSYLAFGALRGVRLMWGRPGTDAAGYGLEPARVELDLPPCSDDHDGGRTAGIFINTVEKRLLPEDLRPRGFLATVAALFRLLTGRFTRHDDVGAAGPAGGPTFLSGAHQQMHVTQLHRAWQGGLRLMVALAIHNRGAEYLASPPRETPPSTDREALDAQVCGMRRLAAHNAEWMEIVYDPRQARTAILSGRLAVVLGAELDELGDLGFASLDEEAQYLWDLGIRQVTPVHGMDNRIGGAAVFEPAYNALNDLFHRGALNLSPAELGRWAPVFFDVRDGGCASGPPAGRRGDCVLYKLGPAQDRAALARTVFSLFSRTPTLVPADVPEYRRHSGHMNTRGLSADGRTYVDALLSRGMMVTIDHMSQQTVDDVAAVFAERSAPLVASHAHFRALGIQDRGRTTAEGFLPDEFDFADRVVERVRASGGTLGTFLYANPIDEHPEVRAPFANDCAASTKGLAYNLLYALHRMGGRGVGLASDFTFVPLTGPRFGENACWGLKDHWDARPDAGPLRDQYRPERQRDGVVYEGVRSPASVFPGNHAPLKPYTMGRRTFDFNVDGLAHYGMLPDLLQDLKNIGLGQREFEALFSSAEDYVVMWETAFAAAADPPAAAFVPRDLPCEAICRGLCP